MTLEEAIKHSEYIVNNRKYAISVCWSVKDCEQLAEQLSELQERRKQSKWTLISEEYPKIGQRVLVTFDDGTIGIRKCDLAEYFDCYYGDVIAWMPAPEESYQLEAKRRTDG